MTEPAHVIETRLHQKGGYSRGWFAVCTCGWTGVLRELKRRGQATGDGYQHIREMKESAA